MKKNWLISLGIIIYIVLSGIDRFIIIVGFRKDKKQLKQENKRVPVFAKTGTLFPDKQKGTEIFRSLSVSSSIVH